MDDRYESEGRKPERERKVVHFIIQGHWRRRSLCVSYLLLLLCRRETHGSLSDLLNISLCFLKMATKCFCFSRSACVNIYVCVSLRGKWGSGSLQEELDSVWVGGWRRRWRPGPGTCTLILPAHVCTSSSRGDVYSRELEGVQNLIVGCY